MNVQGKHALCFATLALAGMSGSAAQALGERAGVAGAVRGSVSQIAYNAAAASVGRVVSSRDPIRLGDRIITGKESGLQVLLLDQTVFTIGPNARMVIDKFVYDPGKARPQIGVSVTKGVFRFVTGNVAKRNPDGFKIKLRVATLSVRGTYGIVLTDGKSATIILEGPGANNNTGDKPSRLLINAGGKSETIHRPSYGVKIPSPGSPPSKPKLYTVDEIRRLIFLLNLRPIGRGGVDPTQATNPGSGGAPGIGANSALNFTNQQNGGSAFQNQFNAQVSPLNQVGTGKESFQPNTPSGPSSPPVDPNTGLPRP